MKKKILCLLTLVVVAAVGVYSFNIKDANASKTITFTEGKTTQDLKSTDGYTYPKGLTVYKAENSTTKTNKEKNFIEDVNKVFLFSKLIQEIEDNRGFFAYSTSERLVENWVQRFLNTLSV